MSYVGNTPTTQGFSPAIDYFNGTGSQTAFTLSRPVASVAQVVVVVNNVTQNPSSAYTVSGNTITFTGAPSSGTNNIYVSYTSPITQVQGLTQSPSVIGPMYVSLNAGTPIGGATNPIMGLSGAANNYVQGYVNNTTNGVNSSADLVAYPSNGTDASGWVDMGITSPTYSQAAFSVTGPNESYLFGSAPSGSGTTGNLVIATDSTGTANSIQFYTNGFTQAKSAAKMVIDGATGNVGIGTSSPASKMHISASYSAPTGGFDGAVYSVLSNSGSANNYAGYCIQGGNNGGSFIHFGDTDSSNAGAVSYFHNGNYMRFDVNGAERARIDSSGSLCIGTTSNQTGGATYRGIVDIISSGGTSTTGINISTTSSAASKMIEFQYTGFGAAGVITTTTNATAYTTSSDYRLKDNITPMAGALNKVAQLKPVTWSWKFDGVESQGFIAHELQSVVPECVVGVKDEVDENGNPVYQTIDTSFLVATLTAAIQEQQALITTLTERITALEAK